MAHAENQIIVPRLGPAVFAFLTDLDHISTWIPAVQKVELVSGTAGQPGADYSASVAVGGSTRKGRLQIVSIDPPNGMVVRIAAPPLRIDGSVTVEDRGDSSELSVVLDAPTGGLLRLMDGQIQTALHDALTQLPLIVDAIPAA
jgi:carbon monoxide dehydrogenase subunit G